MPTVYQIGVNLSTDATGFERGMLKAASAVHKFTLDFQAIGNIAAGISLAGMIQGAASGFKQLVAGQNEAIDANLKLAAVLGISTRNLMGMLHAGDLAGVGNEELGSNLIRLQKNIGEAVRGGGELAEKFTQMGLNAQQLADMPLDEALQAIANAIGNVENRAIRTSMAMDLFGKKGAKMVTILAEGGAGLNNATKEADALGLVVNDSVAKGVEKTNDNMTRLWGVTKGLANSTIGFFSPFVDSAAEGILYVTGFNDAMAETVEKIEETKSLANEGFTIHIGPPTIDLGDFSDDLKTIQSIMDSMVTPAEKLTLQMDAVGRAFMFAEITGEEYADMMKHLADQMPEVENPVRGMIDGLLEQVDAIGKSDKQIALDKAMNLGATIEELQQIEELYGRLEGAARQADTKAFAKGVIEATKTPLEQFDDQIGKLKEALNKKFLSPEQFERAAAAAVDKLKAAGDKPIPLGGPTGFAELGTQDAFRALHGSRQKSGAEKTLADILREQREQTKLQREANSKVKDELIAAKIL